jgi:ligand-binding SRPBCC domain-containing protein
MTIEYKSGLLILQHQMILNEDRAKVWEYLSDPGNLQKITPESMNFEITFRSDNGTGQMYAGQIICYRVSPFPFFRSNWVTEITQVKEGHYFIDEQRFGPYRFWHHQHIISESENGLVMNDVVSLKLPFGIFGRWFGGWLVKRKLREIFEYREKAFRKFFNVVKSD